MNMFVSTAIAGAAVPGSAAEGPIFAAIEAHKAASETTLAEIARYAELERQLQACGRLGDGQAS